MSTVEFVYRALPVRVRFASGAAARNLAAEVAELGLVRLMVIAGAPSADEVTREVADRVVVRFDDVRPHVPVDVAEAARRAAALHSVDGLVTVGGGSTTGTGKAVALTTGLPLVCVPTTYAGSEVTAVWGTTSAARKQTGRDDRVLPRAVVYDPDLTATLPRPFAVSSALNAVAHCVEAFWAPGANPVTSLVAAEGIRVLAAGLRASGAAQREQLLYGSYLAGSAFAVAGSGLHHKICHALGGAFNLPHAETHAAVLPHVLAFNLAAAPDAGRAIAGALGADDAVAGLQALYRQVGAVADLRSVGFPLDRLDEAVTAVCELLPIPNPRPVDAGAVERILRAACA
ncbi:maleylacetate reductase [Amycolatopsis sp. NPDC005232]|uniref:maleylacetate reductase n=1 Tax=Amycolatopsis sp. NPDC005232 TaxID=3157027 RepID=UPI0033BACC43